MPAPKLNDDVRKKILDCIRAGNRLDTAAAYAGINRATFHGWMKRGRDTAYEPYRSFVEDVDAAIAASEVRLVTLITKAAEGSWKPAAWLLQRRFRDGWADNNPDIGPERDESISESLDSKLAGISASIGSGSVPVESDEE